MSQTTYTVGDFRKMIKESANEFKAKLGDGVESTEKKQNKQAYDDAKKRAKDFDGGLDKEAGENDTKVEKVDDNKTMLDYNVAGADDKYRARVKAQVLGYSSEMEQNNGIEKAGDFSGNKKLYDSFKKAGDETHKNAKELNKSGLQSREWDDKNFREDKDKMYEGKVRTAKFKKTTFVNESHMKSRIPDEFKKEGVKFRMTDAVGSTYLCEWCGRDALILEHENKHGMNESLERMRQLMNYKSVVPKVSTGAKRLAEDRNVTDILGKIRTITG